MLIKFWTIVVFILLKGIRTCQNQVVLIGTVEGLSATIPCERFGRNLEAPFWTINGTVYELLSIPRHFHFAPVIDSYAVLVIPFAYVTLNQTTFQCLSFDERGIVSGTFERLIVIPSNRNISYDYEAIEISELVIDYQELLIDESSITLAWFLNDACSNSFEVRGYTLDWGEPVLFSSFRVGSARSFTISSNLLTNHAGVDVDYRIVALDENGHECPSSRDYYYRFSGLVIVAAELKRIDEDIFSTCYSIPQRSICLQRGLNFVWPARAEGRSCSCPVHNSSDGCRVFGSCVEGCKDAVLTPVLTEEGKICMTNFSYTLNGSLFHFICSTEPCVEECFVQTIIASHIILFTDTVPQIAVITHTDNIAEETTAHFVTTSQDETTAHVSTSVPMPLTGSYTPTANVSTTVDKTTSHISTTVDGATKSVLPTVDDTTDDGIRVLAIMGSVCTSILVIFIIIIFLGFFMTRRCRSSQKVTAGTTGTHSGDPSYEEAVDPYYSQINSPTRSSSEVLADPATPNFLMIRNESYAKTSTFTEARTSQGAAPPAIDVTPTARNYDEIPVDGERCGQETDDTFPEASPAIAICTNACYDGQGFNEKMIYAEVEEPIYFEVEEFGQEVNDV